jgi:hypothetical protein
MQHTIRATAVQDALYFIAPPVEYRRGSPLVYRIGSYYEKRNAQFRINTAPHGTKEDTRGRGLRRTVARRTGCIRHQARPHSRSGTRCARAKPSEFAERRLIGASECSFTLCRHSFVLTVNVNSMSSRFVESVQQRLLRLIKALYRLNLA